MPLGLMSGAPTPRPRGSQSALALTVSYRRTSASVRGTPTLNCTVTTARPGRETDITCSMPAICDSTCSAGVATICSTSRTDAPGKGMKHVGHRHVDLRLLLARRHQHGERAEQQRHQRQQRRDLRRLEVGGDAAGDAQRERGSWRDPSAHARGRLRIEGDALAGGDAGQHLDLVAARAPEAHLAQQRHAVRRRSRRRRSARRGARRPAPARRSRGDAGACRRAAARRGRTCPGRAATPARQVEAQLERVAWRGRPSGSSCTAHRLTTGRQPRRESRPGARLPLPMRAAALCGTAAVTRSAAGSYSVNSGRPGMAMSPSTTATSATTPS